VLAKQKEAGITRKLIGFEVTDRGIARDNQEIFINGQQAGKVTSGSPAPFLKKNIGMGYVPAQFANIDQIIEINVRGKMVAAKIVPLPFYKRAK
ncbi:MAG TPA: glycine cleavage T C-terminal barrel domain-containing protein, partial [Chthoniobacterales bacterium]